MRDLAAKHALPAPHLTEASANAAARTAFLAGLAGEEESHSAALASLRATHRGAAQAAQREESNLAARLASYAGDIAAKQSELEADTGAGSVLCARTV
jgi:hypothetical protein